jgi:TonB family protein
MNVQVPTAPVAAPELHLLTEWRDEDRARRAVWAVAGAVVLHIVMFFAAIGLNTYMPLPEPREETVEDLRKAVPLVLPPDALTQKAANKTKVAKELALENLTARPQIRPAPRLFTPPPAPAPAAARPAAPPPMLDAPKVDIAQAPPPVLGNVPKALEPPAAKPPQIQAEKPKLAFETPGAEITKPGGTGRIQVPKEGIEAAMHNAAKPGPGGVSVGDSGVESATPGVGQLPAQPGSAPRQASSLELMSDPMGVDFKPYLIRVLAAVRRNWFAVIPESARYGRRGKVVIQFAISRTGSVPKLVIVMPSGTEAFDRAAVAGVSASNPFPPLPTDFRGDQIRLQLAFSYNMPSR